MRKNDQVLKEKVSYPAIRAPNRRLGFLWEVKCAIAKRLSYPSKLSVQPSTEFFDIISFGRPVAHRAGVTAWHGQSELGAQSLSASA